MPIYTYKHPKKNKFVELVQGMNDKHEFIDEDGMEWERVFFSPNASVDTKMDPHSETEFSNKTRNKKYSVGDIMDHSKELSLKRGNGKVENDPVAKKYFENYSKKRAGKKHKNDPSIPKKIETKDFIIDFEAK